MSLFPVSAGDKVSVSLKLVRRRWTIRITDGAAHRRIITSQEGAGRFREAEWLQEDTAASRPRSFTYPTISGVQFSNLSVDEAAPTRRYLIPALMSAGPRAFAPTTLQHDAFAVVPARLSALVATARAVRTLLRRGGASKSARRAATQLTEITETTPPTKVRAWASRMSAGVIRFDDALGQQRWPAQAHNTLRAMLIALRSQLSILRSLNRVPGSDYPQWRARFKASETTVISAERKFFLALVIPR